MTSVDTTDFAVEVSRGKQWFSHKFTGAGLRYEVGLAILTGDIVWIQGPLPCGDCWNDITIFWLAIMHYLDENERVEADDGYIGEAPKYVKTPNMFTQQEEQLAMQQRVRNRHETVNKHFKQWGCLTEISPWS